LRNDSLKMFIPNYNSNNNSSYPNYNNNNITYNSNIHSNKLSSKDLRLKDYLI
jgi:hypothetical protein